MPPKGPPKASLNALKSMLAAKQAAEQEALRLEQEELARQQEEERRAKEAEEQAERERLLRKEEERKRKEQLRAEGKLMSKAERERQERNKARLEELLKSGNIVVGPTNDHLPEEKAKRPVYTKKSKKPVAPSSDGVAVASNRQAEEKTHQEEEADDVLDDWEAALDSDPEPSIVTAVSAKVEKLAVAPESVGKKQQQREEAREDKLENPEQNKKRELRSPIICILGHVDTGKTKLLDKIRQTNVQEGEAGGITQQIGATYFPLSAIEEKTKHCVPVGFEFKVPGLLVIDTPGHESFTNLRSRGSSLCNIAILVVDIMHGLEPQTLESIGLLRQRKTPFLVALNKIDRLYNWQPHPELPIEEALKKQPSSVRAEFQDRLQKTQLAFAEQGLNASVFYENQDMKRFVNLVPTSAITGDGIGDLIALCVGLTQTMMTGTIQYLSDLECTVLEVKQIEGLGTTIDVILSNGVLREGDRIAVCGLNGPIVTTIRSLLTPQPLRELRIKSAYQHHKQVKAALGVKICAPDLDKAVAGSQLLVVKKEDNVEEAKAKVMADLTAILESVDTSGKGVAVQASTLGSLEALLSFLKTSKIPVSSVAIGPVHKRDVIRASVMLEQDAPEFACMLCFDVKVEKDAQEAAEDMGVKIFTADIIYHLFDQFTAYMTMINEERRREAGSIAVFPCLLKIVPGCVFNKRSPLVMGVDVQEGRLVIGTPICVVREEGVINLGKVSSIEVNHKPVTQVKRGGPSVAIKLEMASWETPRQYGRHFTDSDQLISRVSRASIDVLKESFRDDMDKEDWSLVIKLKKTFDII